MTKDQSNFDLSLVFLLISNLTNGLRLHQFLGTKLILVRTKIVMANTLQ